MAVLLKGQVNLKERTRMGFKSKPINKPLTKREIAKKKAKLMENVLGVKYKKMSISGKKSYLRKLEGVIRRNPRSFNRRMNEFEKYYIAQNILAIELEEEMIMARYIYQKNKKKQSRGGGGGTITSNRNRKTTKSKKKSKTKTPYIYKSKWTKYRK